MFVGFEGNGKNKAIHLKHIKQYESNLEGGFKV